jgi:hypothetical protein
VKSLALPEFWQCFEKLPANIQRAARKNYGLWQQDPKGASLRFKKIKDDLWSVRASRSYRALATFENNSYVWFWIGTHDEYEKLIRNL